MAVFPIRLQGDANFVGTVGDNLALMHGYKLVAVGDEQVGQHTDKGAAFPLPFVVNGGGETQLGRRQGFDRAHDQLLIDELTIVREISERNGASHRFWIGRNTGG
jgi:hypothetical protein